MKLKTLKDMRIFGKSMGKTGQDNSWIFTQNLKEEAIKWVKTLQTYDNEKKESLLFIKHFFNLIEEDLK